MCGGIPPFPNMCSWHGAQGQLFSSVLVQWWGSYKIANSKI